jgi:hypothetical protein
MYLPISYAKFLVVYQIKSHIPTKFIPYFKFVCVQVHWTQKLYRLVFLQVSRFRMCSIKLDIIDFKEC